jgi:cysteine sulfinate desulfinase/cysteine desulfurase-like protein
VIKEFHVPEDLSDSVLRISISAETTAQDIDTLLEAVTEAQGRLARIKK